MSNEAIKSIEEGSFKLNTSGWACEYDGYIITTDKQIIRVGIENHQSCCENWGYVATNDITEEFVGAELLQIKVTDDALTTKEFDGKWEGNTMFVTFETDQGTFQLVMYNEHNGYYGHEAVVQSTQLNFKDYL